ncbi:hypothetical protein ACQP2E_15910 [Actinoplanes sp. CA-015351]|uniref:hypothetical protein n=1 Tax=Actinoplanes sp. CA-015351 TaxID=3239897 RepID=UPI003D95B8F2
MDYGASEGVADTEQVEQCIGAVRGPRPGERRSRQHRSGERDVELPEVYTLLIAMSRAAETDEEVRGRALAIVFDGLGPHADVFE